MKTIWTVAKKEFARFLKDKRLLATLFLPGILIFALYSLIGNAVMTTLAPDESYAPTVYVQNLPTAFEEQFSSLESAGVWTVKRVQEGEADSLLEQLKNKSSSLDLLVSFPENFTPSDLPENRQTIRVYYNSTRTESSVAQQFLATVLNEKLSTALVETLDSASQEDMTAMILSSVAPMLLIAFLFAGCISIVPESIAGEKERGTLGAMLVTPVKRSHVALGKIFALSALSLASGATSFLGLYFSLPKLLAGSGMDFSTASYAVGDFTMILFTLLTSVVLIVTLLSVASTFAKSVKEATSAIGPFALIPVLVGVVTMFAGSSTGNPALYFIPIYNSVRVLGEIFSFAGSPLLVVITCLSNLAWSAILAIAISKMFNNERIMFNK